MWPKLPWLQVALVVVVVLHDVAGRKHHLEIRDDYRRYIALSTFGFYRDGFLDVNFHDFQLTEPETSMLFGLSLDKTMTDAMNPYLDTHQDKCLLREPASSLRHGPILLFEMIPSKNITKISCSLDWKPLHIYKNRSDLPITSMMGGRGLEKISDSSLFQNRNKRAAAAAADEADTGGCKEMSLPLIHTVKDDIYSFSFSFVVFIASEEEEGLYNLYFHSCPNYEYNPAVALSFNVEIEENNHGNYLSAGEMPLPALYFMMSILFLLSGIFWVFILRKSKHPVFKIHYLMAGLVFLKSLSLLFHAINYHFIEIKGEHVAAWAILYYITHLMKGAVLFTTIVLIGSGWTIIKHFLTDRDKKIFMIIIPLQVLANIADIILAESEEGDIEHRTWADILIMVDLICCGAILFPVVGSIKHFQEASTTDGKAAINLRKLKLFRQFYIMVVGYIYFTRIIVYLLRVTVPFQLAWMDEMFREMATFVFFASTGYKFRPASAHPYFTVDASDDDDVEEEALTESGITEGLSKVHNRSAPPSSNSNALTLRNYEDSHDDDEERQNLLSKRESSHEYD